MKAESPSAFPSWEWVEILLHRVHQPHPESLSCISSGFRRMAWSTTEIDTIPVELFRPTERSPKFSLLFLPDSNLHSLHHLSLLKEWLTSEAIFSACPMIADCWWSNRPDAALSVSAEKFILERILPTVFGPTPGGTGILGLGSGGQGAIRLGLRHPTLFPIAAGIDSDLDHYEKFGRGSSLDQLYATREQCRQDSAVLHVHPSRQPRHFFLGVNSPGDVTFRGNDRLHEKLNALGVAHRFEIAAGVTLLERLKSFLREAIEIESRRLL